MRALAAFSLVLASASACAPAPPAPAPAAVAASVTRGQALAEKWCADCHRIGSAQQAVRRPEMRAPDFAAVIDRPEVDAAYLARFMEVQHLPMTVYRLAAEEKSDVVAYLVSLKPKR